MNIHYRLSQLFSIFSFVRSNSILAPKFVCTRIGRDKILYLILCLTFSMPINVKQRKGIAVDTIFCPTPIHASKQRQKKNIYIYIYIYIYKGCKYISFKAKKGEKINKTCLNSESKSHNGWKNHFTKNLTKTLTRYGQKLTFWSNHWIVLDFRLSSRSYFFLQNDSV